MYSLSYRLKSLSPFCTVIDLFGYVDCKTVDSFLKIGLVWLKSFLTRAKRAILTLEARGNLFLVSLPSLPPDPLCDCSRVLECAKIRTVLQSTGYHSSEQPWGHSP